MKILHTEASAGWGGQELRILTEMQGLRDRGHVLELAAPSTARIAVEAAALGFQVHDVPLARKNLRGLLAVRKLLAQRAFDVINTHSSTDSWLVALINATRTQRVPQVRTRHISAPVPRNRATRWLYDKACAAVVTTGEKLRTELVEVNGFTHVPIRSVPTGVDPLRFAPGNAQHAKAERGLSPIFNIGIVATLRSWKGHRFLVESVAELRAGNLPIQLTVVGDGPQRDALVTQVQDAGLGDCVLFVGHDACPERWLKTMDLFVLPSYANEGVPQALMQAMMSGLPCVTTDVGAIGEIAIEGQTALLVPGRDTNALSAAIRKLYRDSALRESLGIQARKHALDRCTLNKMSDAMEEIFRAASLRL